jgi:hypothetical protein
MPFNLITKIFSAYSKIRINQIIKIKQDPYKYQERFLFSILCKAQNTEYGKKYNFQKIKSLEDFQNNIPVVTYEDLFPYVERMMKGEKDVLWDGLVSYFSKSSGTTARSKFLPVSKELLQGCFKAGQDELSLYLNNNKTSKVLEGKSIFMGGSWEKINDNPEIFLGDISAILMQKLPALGRLFRTPSLKTATLSDYEIKLEKMAEETMHQDVRSLAGTPTWTIALIKKVVEKRGVKDILEVWPNLEIFFHGAVSFAPYRQVFKELIKSPKMHYVEAYNASEGFFGLQDEISLKEGEMWLSPDYGVFYEFIPMSEFDKENPKIYTLKDVKLEEDYALIISTNAGLWRYLIGDTVKFISLFPHRIIITGRTKHFINVFGEEVVVHNTDEAIKKTCLTTDSQILDYTVAPFFMDQEKNGGHEWIIEFEKEPLDRESFIEILDKNLREINSDYDAKRHKDIILKKPIVHFARQNTFFDWLKSKGKLGGQNKVPRLSNYRKNIEEILEFLN